MALAVARRQDSPARRTWRIQRRWVLAGVVASFPLLFILDKTVDSTMSPVLPGLVLLLAVLLALPYALMEVQARRPSRLARIERADTSSKYALASAGLWFVLWLVFG